MKTIPFQLSSTSAFCLIPSIAQNLYRLNIDQAGSLACELGFLSLFLPCQQWYLQVASADPAVSAMFLSGHLPGPPLEDLSGHPYSPAPTDRKVHIGLPLRQRLFSFCASAQLHEQFARK
jgi:hypothetical protein